MSWDREGSGAEIALAFWVFLVSLRCSGSNFGAVTAWTSGFRGFVCDAGGSNLACCPSDGFSDGRSVDLS